MIKATWTDSGDYDDEQGHSLSKGKGLGYKVDKTVRVTTHERKSCGARDWRKIVSLAFLLEVAVKYVITLRKGKQ